MRAKPFLWLAGGLLAGVLLWLILSRGGDESAAPGAAQQSLAPFREAVARYCAERSYGMTLAGIEEIEVDPPAGTARAICKMKDAEGLYGMAIRWRVFFERSGEGDWRVARHEAK